MNVKDSDNIIEAARLIRSYIIESDGFMTRLFEKMSSVVALKSVEANHAPSTGLEIELIIKDKPDTSIQSSDYVGLAAESILDLIIETKPEDEDDYRLRELLNNRSLLSSFINVLVTGPSSIIIKI